MSETSVDFTDLGADGKLARRLDRWAGELWPDAEGIENLHRMPGNAGLSCGFDVRRGGGGDGGTGTPGRRAGYVIRFAPPGVRRQGNTDVLRQVPLLRFLAGTEVPIAELVWSTSDPSWFGTEAIVQEYLAGSPLGIRDPKWAGQEEFVQRAVDAALGTLHTIHSTPAIDGLPDWEVQHSVAEETALWSRLLEKSAEGEVLELGAALRDALLAAEPRGHLIGLTHGDFQTNNVLFDMRGGVEGVLSAGAVGTATAAGTVTVRAVVDWELASIGPVGRDLGWLAMMLDPEVWAPEWAENFPVRLDPDLVVGSYEQYSGEVFEHFAWYKAYACFKYGSILSFNHYLHVTGKRVDPIYESLASSREALFQAGLSLVE